MKTLNHSSRDHLRLSTIFSFFKICGIRTIVSIAIFSFETFSRYLKSYGKLMKNPTLPLNSPWLNIFLLVRQGFTAASYSLIFQNIFHGAYTHLSYILENISMAKELSDDIFRYFWFLLLGTITYKFHCCLFITKLAS